MVEMFLRKIPEDMRPWECNVNGVKYVYPAGTEQNVPAEVAAIIDAYWENQEVDYPETGISFNDLRDRPFYESTEVLFDQRVELQDSNNNGFCEVSGIGTDLIDGQTYRVTVNGAEYECVAAAVAPTVCRLEYFNEAEEIRIFIATGMEDGEYFVYAEIYPYVESASIRIEGVVVKTLDPKFIPAGVGGGVVIVQDSAMASGVAVVDQDAQTATMNAAQIAEAIFAGKTVYFLEPNDGTLLPFVYGYRFGELASGVMTLNANPEPFALFGAHDSGGYYHRITVYSDGAYTTGGFSVGS